MKDTLVNVLKTAGTAALATTPLGSAALQVIGAVTGKDFTGSESGEEVMSVINQLPAEQRATLLAATINKDVAMEDSRTERYKAMCAADGQETRAKIVVLAMKALIGLTAVCILIMGWVYVNTTDAQEAFSMEMMAVFAVLLGPFAYVVRAYFGDLKSETESRHRTIDEKQPAMAQGIAGAIQALRGR